MVYLIFSFRVLGKFGGGNRKMMIEPQRLEYVSSEFEPPSIQARFHDQEQPIQLPVSKVRLSKVKYNKTLTSFLFQIIDTAFNALKQSNTDPFYRKQAWEVINCYLTASRNLNDDENTLIKLFLHPSFQDPSTIPNIKGSTYKSICKEARETHQTALTGI